MASRQDGVTQLYDLPQGGGPERLACRSRKKQRIKSCLTSADCWICRFWR